MGSERFVGVCVSPRRREPSPDGRTPFVANAPQPKLSASLEQGLAILECFTPERQLLGVSDVAVELGMSRATTHRYLKTLKELGFLEQGPARKYRMTRRVTALGMSAMSSTALSDHALWYMKDLSTQSTHTVSMAVLDGREIVYVGQARGIRPQPDLFIQPGSRLPAYCTAMGKLLLAYLPDEPRLTAIEQSRLIERGPNTITSIPALQSELEQAREEGFAVDDEELLAGHVAMAVPVRDERHDVVAALDITTRSSMCPLEQLVDTLGPHLLATADRISARLGFRHNHRQPTHHKHP